MSSIAVSNQDIAATQYAAEPAKSFWRKMYERMVVSQQLRAEKYVAAYVASHGGLLTDDMERSCFG